jgi:hypothetical protein
MTTKLARVIGITMGVAATLTLTALGQTMTEERGTNRRGNDYTSFPAGTAADCQDACARDRRCRAYTFDGAAGACFLKDRVPSASSSRGSTSGVKQDYAPPAGGGNGGDVSGLGEERGVDYPGGDYTSTRVHGLQECQNQCRYDRRCTAYSFDVRAVVCYLKDRVNSPRRDDSKIGGVKGSGRPPYPGESPGNSDLTELRGSDYHGGDYTSVRVRELRQCQEQCRRERRCLAYSYGIRDAICYLKDRVGPLRRDSDKVTGLKQRY